MELRSSKNSTVLVLLFLAILLAVPVATVLSPDADRSASEKRSLAVAPRFGFDRKALTSFPSGFEHFFNDHFGFRGQMVYLNSLIKVGLLGTSSNEKVVVGKAGWFFLADERAMAPEPFTSAQLKMWRISLEAKQAWLKARGAEYVFMVAPEKHTIYPEYLPRSCPANSKPSNLDQLIEYLKHTSTVRVLDVRSPLRAAKVVAPVYYQTDTHWNLYGGAVACQELLHRVSEYNPSVRQMDLNAAVLRNTTFKAGNLALMLLLQDVMADREVEPVLPTGTATVLISGAQTPDGLLLTISENHVGQQPNVVVFHDSMFDSMNRYFVQHFGRAVMVGGRRILKFEQDIIERERPQVVVEEIVERYLTGQPFVPDEILNWYQLEGRK